MEGIKFALTDHANLRSAQRNMSDDEIEFILKHGNRLRRTGVIFCQLRKVDLPTSLSGNHRMRRLVGSTVVLSKCATQVLTMYRDDRAFNRDSRKTKFRKNKYDRYSFAY